MTYTPTNWVAHETLISADRMNNIESGIAALYPQETIIAPEQTVTITSETLNPGVPITLAEGYELPVVLPTDWLVMVNGHVLAYIGMLVRGYSATVDDVTYRVAVDPRDGGLYLACINANNNQFVPGDYTVKITQTGLANPTVKAFPVSAGSGSVQFVIDAPKEDVDAAMANGCVLLYAASPSASSGFAFGCLIGNVMYYATVGEKIAWNADTVTLRNGKYVVLGEG